MQGCALSTMVGQMTFGKRQFEDLDKKIRQLLPPLHGAMQGAIPMIDADTDAFNDYMASFLIFPFFKIIIVILLLLLSFTLDLKLYLIINVITTECDETVAGIRT